MTLELVISLIVHQARGPILLGTWAAQPNVTNDHHVWSLYKDNL